MLNLSGVTKTSPYRLALQTHWGKPFLQGTCIPEQHSSVIQMRDSGQSVAPAHVNVAPAPSSVESNVHDSSVKKYGILDMCVERKQLSWKWVKRQVALCESHGSTSSLECAAQSCKSRNQTFSVEQRQAPQSSLRNNSQVLGTDRQIKQQLHFPQSAGAHAFCS